MTIRADLPFAARGMRVGLLGGSFDPSHDGHVLISEFAMTCFNLDRVWWLVSPGNPLKSHQPAPLASRIDAARRLLNHPRIFVTDVESKLGTQLTADTIAALQNLYTGVHFVWLMGSDNLVQFHQWERWDEIAARVPIGVLARPGSRLPARQSRAARVLRRWRLPVSQARALSMSQAPAWTLVNLPMSPLSSSAIRRKMAAQAKESGKT